jgi:hypothetical protein
MQESAKNWLDHQWRELRNDKSLHKVMVVTGAIFFGLEIGALTVEESELWLRRINTCPGHDDEGGRKWCAYCGDLKECYCGKPNGFHDEDLHEYNYNKARGSAD